MNVTHVRTIFSTSAGESREWTSGWLYQGLACPNVSKGSKGSRVSLIPVIVFASMINKDYRPGAPWCQSDTKSILRIIELTPSRGEAGKQTGGAPVVKVVVHLSAKKRNAAPDRLRMGVR